MRKLTANIVAAVVGVMLAGTCFAGTALASSSRTDDTPAYPPYIEQPAKKPLIGKKAAKQIAFDEAGVKKKRCSNISADLRKRAKKKVYVVNFTHRGIMKYHYVIAARTGKVLSYYAKHV